MKVFILFVWMITVGNPGSAILPPGVLGGPENLNQTSVVTNVQQAFGNVELKQAYVSKTLVDCEALATGLKTALAQKTTNQIHIEALTVCFETDKSNFRQLNK